MGDSIQIGPYTYRILERREKRVLVAWTESDGTERTMWCILPVAKRLARVAV